MNNSKRSLSHIFGLIALIAVAIVLGIYILSLTNPEAGPSSLSSPKTAQTGNPEQLSVPQPQQLKLTIEGSQAEMIGHKIWLNESAGKLENLIVWNDGEEFVSLGIGHFIWYPAEGTFPFDESFPEVLEFFEEHGIVLPAWLNRNSDCPWRTKEEFTNNFQSPEMLDLQRLLRETVLQQVEFLLLRLERALPQILETLPEEKQRVQVREQFYRVAQSPGGLYALVDYVNFKGEGVSPSERYNNQGWGLLQVLSSMKNETSDPLDEFADAAEYVLTLRTQNAPEERNEARWLPGWKKRINTYRNIRG